MIREAIKALDEAIPQILRNSRHGENFLGQRYATIHNALREAELLLDDTRCNFTRDDDLPDNLLPRIDNFLGEKK